MNKVFILVGSWLFLFSVQADVRMNPLFSEGMVIQRNTVAPFWGWADAGEKITVSTSWGVKSSTTADANGDWRVQLKTPEAGVDFEITVVGKNTVVIRDVAVGEVWFCGGQSNMDCGMEQFMKDAKDARYQPLVEYIREEVQGASDSLLRHIAVPRNTSPNEKVTDFEGRWVSVSPETLPEITATGYFFARELRKYLDVPIGLVECSWGGTRIQPWLSKEAYLSEPKKAAYYKTAMNDLQRRAKAWTPEEAQKNYTIAIKKWETNGKEGRRPKKSEHPFGDKHIPATMYNGMVEAVIPYAIKGVIWYQGETNRHHKPEEYGDYFSTLIHSWRKAWNQGDFPFYWAQLAAYGEADTSKAEAWANICDQQRRCLEMPHTGMAVLNDIGESKDIHPHNKIDAGKRLALWALANDYGVNVPAYSGPLYQSYEIKDRKVLIQFCQSGSGLMVGHKNLLDEAVEVDEALNCFQIAGSDQEWKQAHARIVGLNTVEVTHPSIANPVAVRYAWASFPEGANLYNKEGLPASIFTTE